MAHNSTESRSSAEESVFDFATAGEANIKQLRSKLYNRGVEERWIIPSEEIEFSDNFMSKGSFGSLQKLKWRELDCLARSYPGQEFSSLKGMSNEISILSSLRHPNVVLFLGACLEESNTILIMEFYSLGNLNDFVKTRKKKFKPKQIRQGIKDVALAVNFLHKSNVIHRSLNPTCILVDKSGKLVIGNFGSSRFTDDKTVFADEFHHKVTCEAYPYQCPEFLAGKEYNQTCDVYSLAMISYFIATMVEPFADTDANDVKEVVLSGVRPPLDKVKDKHIKAVFADCWTDDLSKRLLANEIVKRMEAHPNYGGCKVQ
mmetsp:Transcript_6060/g.7345  ORF Transcript_6060/g.7345 Transcript_6060/m.7345 type:complete len:316 (+) Transcript_6060:514-1461(+)